MSLYKEKVYCIYIIRYEDGREGRGTAESKEFLLSTAESCTGGGIAALITSVPGARSILKAELWRIPTK